MPFLQVTYHVPVETAAQLAAGEATRIGSVIRGSQHITSHLKEVSSELLPDATDVAKQAAAGAKKNAGMILVGIGVAVAAVAATAWITKAATEKSVRKELTAQQALTPSTEQAKAITTYNEAVGAYLEAIDAETMSEELVSNLQAALEELRQESNEGTITLKFSVEQSEALLAIVAGYTEDLARANSFDLSKSEDTPADAQNPIVELRHYLGVQKQIIDKAA